MRYGTWAALVAALLLTGCLTPRPGPGADCDPCAQAEATPVGAGSSAAAAAASGGQRANQAPFAEDTARLAPQTTIGRGQGATTSSSQDSESRHVASGGAQNLGVVLPTEANAATLGGVSPAVQEAAMTVKAARDAYQMAACSPTTTTERLRFLAEQLSSAQAALNAAQAGSQVQYVTNNNFQGSRVQQFGVSTSATGKDQPVDPAVVAPMAEAAAALGTAGLEEYETSSSPSKPSTPPPAPVEPEALPEPPAGTLGSPLPGGGS